MAACVADADIIFLPCGFFLSSIFYLFFFPRLIALGIGPHSSFQLECGPMPNVMAALPNIGGALCSTPQSLADAHYWSTVQ